MRFLMVDRVLALEPGRRIRTLKLPSLGEEYLREHFPRRALVPGSLLLECLAQAAGRLVCASHGYALMVVLTVAEDVALAHDLAPGYPVEVEAELLGTSRKGSIASAQATADGRTVARAGRLLFGHFPHPDPAGLRARLESTGGAP